MSIIRCGAFLEYGTKHQPPLGFIRKAYDEKGQDAADEAVKIIQTELEMYISSIGKSGR